jgi:16S rRNA (uracil1498-N3)-methyltransferase
VAHMYGVDGFQRLIPGATISLTAEEARHAATVARLRVGERVKVSNGRGTVALVEASDVSPTEVLAVVVDVTHHQKLSPELWLVQALAKGGRDEHALEQAVELGVSRVIPWQAARSVSVWRGDKVDKGQARWAKIAHEAAKQSRQPWWPEVSSLAVTKDLVSLSSEASVVVLDPDAPLPLTAVVELLPDDKPIALVVGPEGGISAEERDQMMAAGAVAVRLGPTVLRTSTAGPVALALTLAARGLWDSTAPGAKNL